MRVLLCDDHAMFLEALVDALEARGHTVLAALPTPHGVPDLVERLRPDVTLLDVDLPGRSGVDVARELALRDLPTRVVLLTAGTEDWIRDAFDCGLVAGLLTKDGPIGALDAALRRVAAGERTLVGWHSAAVTSLPAASPVDALTDREREVLTLIARGASTSAMAGSLGVSPNTVRSHVRSVMQKLGVHHRGGAAHTAFELGLVG